MAMEVLGLLDTLESMVLEGARIPFTKKVMVNEEKVLSLIDKIRLVFQEGGNSVKKAIDKDFNKENGAPFVPSSGEAKMPGVVGPDLGMDDAKAIEVIQQAYQMAKEVRGGADKYADEVLSNLEATSARILRTIHAGRERLRKSIGSNIEVTTETRQEKETVGVNS